MKKFVISSGHGKIVGGAVGFINERAEAVKVVDRVYAILTNSYNGRGYRFHESTAQNQSQNLANIVNYHNSKDRELDVSVHFNSATATATGTECLYYDAKSLSTKMSAAMAKALDIRDRGPKERKELYFLRNTTKPAILLEVCFVSNKDDVTKYKANFERLCQAVAKVIADYLGYKKEATTPSPDSNKASYYTSNDLKGLYRIKKDCYLYNSVKFDKKNREQEIKKGEAITALEIVKYKHTHRLKTKYGYVTANKEFVEKV
ncbi:N-acetylmuramoyl-L-alanine amidase [Kurthia gibsonii]|uniref:N-acetylmuramoyl-L-alanine amidase n=1 Tax=Kurthia gibsonii TaxID=33946 RepID=UPI0031B6A64A